MKKNQILFLEPKEEVYGGQHALLQRCAYLSAQDEFEFLILHPFESSKFSLAAGGLGLEKYLRQPWKRPARSYKQGLYYFTRFLLKENPAVVHVDGFDSCYLLCFLKLLGLIRTKIVFTLRSDRYHRFNFIDRLLLKRVNHLITNSNYSRDHIYMSSGLNAAVHYSPIDFDSLMVKLSAVSSLESDDKIIISYVGALEPRKNFSFFIDVAKVLIKKNSRYVFHIYGDAKNAESIGYLKSISDGLTEVDRLVIKFNGYVPIEHAIANTDVLLCPFKDEPLGRVVPEFLYCGKKVVVSSSGGLREAGAGYASSYQEDSLSDCVDKIESVFATNLGPAIEEVRVRLKQIFSNSSVVEKDIEVYRLASGE